MGFAYRITDQSAIYFVTITVVGWVDVFSRPTHAQVILDSLGYCQANKGLRLHGWCIMSNHLHLIVSASEGHTLSDIIRDFKKYTSIQIHKSLKNPTASESRRDWMLRLFNQAGTNNPNNLDFQLWRQENHPELLESEKFFSQKLDYIHENPVRAGLVEFPWEYRYSSARDYLSNRPGLLKIDFLD